MKLINWFFKPVTTKVFLCLSAICVVPFILAEMLLGVIGLDYCMGQEIHFVHNIVTGVANEKFIGIICAAGGISGMIMFTSNLMLLRYADKIDKLDEATKEYYEAVSRYNRAVAKFADKA